MGVSVSDTAEDPLDLYEELVSRGEPPDIEAFCAAHPNHPQLAAEIRKLEALRRDLDTVAREMMAPPQVPSVLGNYRLGERLGGGGSADVYHGVHLTHGGEAAVKIMRYLSAPARERFGREVAAASLLVHPNIARVLAWDDSDPHPYIVVELIDGKSLSTLLRHELSAGVRTAPQLRRVVTLMCGVAEALAFAHHHQVIHRDIKPSNVMVTPEDRPVLIDFGLALLRPQREHRVTRTGVFVGSHNYAAPEQVRGDKPQVGSWTDTFALGATLYEALTGEPPFLFPNAAARAADPDRAPPKTAQERNPLVPRALQKLLNKALHPQPKKRYRDGGQLLAALNKVSKGLA